MISSIPPWKSRHIQGVQGLQCLPVVFPFLWRGGVGRQVPQQALYFQLPLCELAMIYISVVVCEWERYVLLWASVLKKQVYFLSLSFSLIWLWGAVRYQSSKTLGNRSLCYYMEENYMPNRNRSVVLLYEWGINLYWVKPLNLGCTDYSSQHYSNTICTITILRISLGSHKNTLS